MQRAEFDDLRKQYSYACGYCHVTEISVGGELTIDHFKPRSAGGGDDRDNLVYACQRCNSYKHHFWPSDEQLRRGHRILHPIHDELASHIYLNRSTGRLEAWTPTGEFHITILQLNRPPLVKRRLAQQLAEVVQQKLMLVEQQNREMRTTMQIQQRYIALLELLLNQHES